LKLSEDGLAVIAGAVTFSVTGMLAGLPDAPVDDTATAPKYAPTASPLVFTETLTDPGTVVPLGVATSQIPPLVEVEKIIPEVPCTLTT
jgi:hypothetical protein